MLTTLLDDSEISKIRKSIFLFASIIFFAYFYKLGIDVPKMFTTSLPDMNRISIDYLSVLKILGIFQIYLLIRLCLSFKIHLAIFEKNWKIDEFKEDENLISLKDELEQFNKNAEEKINFRNILLDLDEKFLKVEEYQKNIEEPINKAIRISEKTAVNESKLNDYIQKMGNRNTFSKDDFSEIYHFKCNKLPHLVSEISSVSSKLNSLKDDITPLLSDLNEFENKFKTFNDKFPKSNYNAVINVNQNSLIKSKNYKKSEMYIFELILPSIICAISLFIIYKSENDWCNFFVNIFN